MSPINIPPEGKGQINLVARCFIMGAYRECFIIEASSITQSAVVQVLGSLFMQPVPFRNIANVALKYDDGTVAKNFGAPKASKPESVEYIESNIYYQEFDEYSDADSGL
jgi:hypothetical protein